MADAPAFDWMCTRLEQNSPLDRLEARGTVRLALKSAGLAARSVTPTQMKVVIEKILVGELAARGVEDIAVVCSRLTTALASESASLEAEGAEETPDAVFTRLGGGA